jgi:hypothetical protein
MDGLGRGRLVVLGLTGLVAAIALGACDGGQPNSTSGAPPAADQQGAAPGAGQGKSEQQENPAGAPVKFRVDERAIIYTGSITVRVQDVDKAAASAATIVSAAGGFIGGDKRTSDDSHSQATLQLRVPAGKFSAVVDDVAKLGDQEARDINTQDVTEESIDLDARIATQRARVDSARQLLAKAQNLSDLVMLEGEVGKREADLASLEAKKRRIDDLTALSTITAVLLGPDAQPSDEPQTGFLAGLKHGWRAFVTSLQVLLTVLGALLPWLVALGLPVAAALWLIRRLGERRRPQPVPAAPASPAPQPPPPDA